MKVLFWLLFIFFAGSSLGQEKKTIYCFPGQGADQRLFDSLKVDTSYELKFVDYGSPEKNASMQSFALKLSEQIDTSKPFVLLGVSLGGMICVELSEILNPEKTIIISSAKNKRELPFRYKFQKSVPIYKLFGGKALLVGAKTLQPIVEPDRNKNKATFKKMLAAKTPTYMKRSITLIINWERESNSKKIYHIHGKKDHTLPYRNISKPDFTVKQGSHMITLTKAKEISIILNQILKN